MGNFMLVVKDSISTKAFRELILGIAWQGQTAQKMGAVNDLYTEEDEKETKIKQFAKKFARVGAMREGIKRNKEFYYQNTI